jgi:hypothetical protein
MKNSKKSGALLLALSGLAIAATAQAAGLTWGPNVVTVSRVSVEAPATGSTTDGEIYVGFAVEPIETGCAKQRYGLWVIGGNMETRKAMLQVALSAKLSGQKVKVLWNDTSGARCTGGTNPDYPIIRGLELQP